MRGAYAPGAKTVLVIVLEGRLWDAGRLAWHAGIALNGHSCLAHPSMTDLHVGSLQPVFPALKIKQPCLIVHTASRSRTDTM